MKRSIAICFALCAAAALTSACSTPSSTGYAQPGPIPKASLHSPLLECRSNFFEYCELDPSRNRNSNPQVLHCGCVSINDFHEMRTAAMGYRRRR